MMRSLVFSGIRCQRALLLKRPGFVQSLTTTSGPEPALLPVTTLTEDEELLKQSVAQFAREKVAPLVRAMDRDATMTPELIKDLHVQGKL